MVEPILESGSELLIYISVALGQIPAEAARPHYGASVSPVLHYTAS